MFGIKFSEELAIPFREQMVFVNNSQCSEEYLATLGLVVMSFGQENVHSSPRFPYRFFRHQSETHDENHGESPLIHL
jgi:hypothetical protein